jgi:hypothetical protein
MGTLSSPSAPAPSVSLIVLANRSFTQWGEIPFLWDRLPAVTCVTSWFLFRGYSLARYAKHNGNFVLVVSGSLKAERTRRTRHSHSAPGAEVSRWSCCVVSTDFSKDRFEVD